MLRQIFEKIIKKEKFPSGMEVMIVRSDGHVEKWTVVGNKDGVVAVILRYGEGLDTGEVPVDKLEEWQKIPFETGQPIGPIKIKGMIEKDWVFNSYDDITNQVGIAKVVSPQENRTLKTDLDTFLAMIVKK